MIVIPDYLIIDEIRRKEEARKHPRNHFQPSVQYDIDITANRIERQRERKSEVGKRQNGAIIIDINGNHKI